MELGRTKNWFYILLAAAVVFIFILGAWWLYLVFKLAYALESAGGADVPKNFASMVQWEGLSFFALLLAVGTAVFYVFWQDHKKTKSLQTFYATLTHELKTPLASMRLQAQVLSELIQGLSVEKPEKEKIERYGKRLEEDVVRLENELDKHLQLSRAEGGGNLNLTPLALLPLINSAAKKYPELSVTIHSTANNPTVLGDQTAMSIIFKNLFENTMRHNKSQDKRAEITVQSFGDEVKLVYDDKGEKFKGSAKQLGKLFYKHNSPKGSGIGLYLAKVLAKRQGAKFSVINFPRLTFELKMKRGEELE